MGVTGTRAEFPNIFGKVRVAEFPGYAGDDGGRSWWNAAMFLISHARRRGVWLCG